MNVFDDARSELAGKLTAAGLAATLDPAALPPFVLVDLPDGTETPFGIGGWPVTVPVKIVVPPPGDAAAGTALLDQLEVVWRTLGWAPAYPTTVTVGAADCPAYVVTYPVDVPNPDC